MVCSTTNKNSIKNIYICDKCGKSDMKPTGKVLFSNPPFFEHKCDECGYVKEFKSCYPVITII